MCDLKRIRILNPLNGDILNRCDGVEDENGLKINVTGVSPLGTKVDVNGITASTEGELFKCSIALSKHKNIITVSAISENVNVNHSITVFWDKGSYKRYSLQTDDNIIWLYDLAKNANNYRSIFENNYLAFWKDMYDRYKIKIQHNIYYETTGFDLSQMPEKYKNEFQENASWMKLAMHAKSPNPPKPYLSATYQKMKNDYILITNEIIRFAGPEVLSPYYCCHWGRASIDACRALKDHGIKGFTAVINARDQDDDPCYYLSDPLFLKHLSRRDYWQDTDEDVIFLICRIVLNWENDSAKLLKFINGPSSREVLSLIAHEHSFYPTSQRPDQSYMREQISQAIELINQNNYKPIFYDEGFIGNVSSI